MDEWVDLKDEDLIKLEEEIHSHLNASLKKGGEAPKKSPVPPLPDALPEPDSPGSESSSSSSSSSRQESPPRKLTPEEEAAEREKKEAAEIEAREQLQPPPRRLRSRIKEIGNKLRAKL